MILEFGKRIRVNSHSSWSNIYRHNFQYTMLYLTNVNEIHLLYDWKSFKYRMAKIGWYDFHNLIHTLSKSESLNYKWCAIPFSLITKKIIVISRTPKYWHNSYAEMICLFGKLKTSVRKYEQEHNIFQVSELKLRNDLKFEGDLSLEFKLIFSVLWKLHNLHAHLVCKMLCSWK
jgi:hypothetical protein